MPHWETLSTRSRKGLEKPRGFIACATEEFEVVACLLTYFERGQMKMPWVAINWGVTREQAVFRATFFRQDCMRLISLPRHDVWQLLGVTKQANTFSMPPLPIKIRATATHTQNAIWHSLAHFTNNLTTHTTWPLKICVTPSSNSFLKLDSNL